MQRIGVVDAEETVNSSDAGVNANKADLISQAIDRYGLKSIIDVGACSGVNGAYTFHALASGKIERAVITDGEITDITRKRAAGGARSELRQGDIGDADFIDALSHSDAAIMFDVLLHQVGPRWDDSLQDIRAKWITSSSTIRIGLAGTQAFVSSIRASRGIWRTCPMMATNALASGSPGMTNCSQH